jgi:hypothetical protein
MENYQWFVVSFKVKANECHNPELIHWSPLFYVRFDTKEDLSLGLSSDK